MTFLNRGKTGRGGGKKEHQRPRKKTRSDEMVSEGDIRINRDKVCDSTIRYSERGANGRK